MVIKRRVYDLEVLQKNYQIQNNDKRLARPPIEDHVTAQQPPQRQRPEVNGQDESATRRHVS
jgi:hypothetical protein